MDKRKAGYVKRITALMNARRWPQAEAQLAQALWLYPGDYGFQEFLGVTKARQGQTKEAVRIFRKALKSAPKSTRAHRFLANAEMEMGDLNKAQATLTKSLQLDPNFAEGWFFLGKVYGQKDQQEKAIDAYTKAARLKPDAAVIAAELLLLLERTNKREALAERVVSLDKYAPDHPLTKLFHGIVHYLDKDYERARDSLESHDFTSKSMKIFHSFELMRIRYLGKTYDSLHLEEQAFACFTRSNELNRVFDKNAADPRLFRQDCAVREAYYKSDAPRNWEPASTFEDSPVFMVGFPRSGTTLLDTFLRGHKEFSLLEEVPTVAAMRRVLKTGSSDDIANLDRLDQKKLADARKAYLDMRRSYGGKGIVVDKLPLNLVFAGEILRVFPKARFILVLRDPADAVFSCFMQNFILNPPMATLDSPIEAAKTYHSAMQIWKDTVAALNPAVVNSRYESLISDPESTLRPITEFLGVEWIDSMLDHQKTAKSRGRIHTPSYAQVVEPLYKSSVARWERYAHLMPEALEIRAPWRKEFGYSD